MSRFKLGVVLEGFGLPPRAALAAASRLGVGGVQFDAVGDLAPDRLGDTARRELKTVLRSFNLEAAAVGCPLRRGLDAADDLQPRVEHVAKVLQLAYDLGARKVVVPFPRLPADAESPKAATLREALTAVGAAGDRTGSSVCLEIGLDPAAAVRDYLAGFDAGSLRVTFDPANFLANGHDPLANLAALGGLVAHTHARDARTATAAGGPREVPVGAGDVEWMAYVATLESIDYRGYLAVERLDGDDKPGDLAAGVRFLRRFVPAAGE